MNPQQLLAHFDRLAEAPDAVPRLRRFILELAIRGKLLKQSRNDEPASVLLNTIRQEKKRLIKEGLVRPQQPPQPIDTDDQFFALPPGWEWTKLGDLILLLSGQHLLPSEYSDRPSSGPPYITGPADFGTNGLIISRYALVRKAVATQGQVLLTVKGAGVGKTAFCDHPEVAISRQLMALSPIGWNHQFLMLLTDELAERLKSKARSLIPGIGREDVDSFVFGLPPLAEQRRIVAKVDELMRLCDQLEASQAERERRRDRLVSASLHRLNEASDPDTFREHARFHLHHLPRLTTRPDQIPALRQTILNLAVRGKLCRPSGWPLEPSQLRDHATLQNGYAFKSEWFAPKGVRLLRNANVGHGTIRWDDVAFLPESRSVEFERFQLDEGDIVLSLDRPFIATGTKVSRVCSEDLPCLLLQRVGRFQPRYGTLCPDYLFLWLHSPHFTTQVDPGRSNGVPHISSKQVEATEIFVPSLAEQQRIVTKVNELMAVCDELESQLNAADRNRQRLLEAVLHDALTPAD